jgi:hypothetical protein
MEIRKCCAFPYRNCIIPGYSLLKSRIGYKNGSNE